MKVLGWQEASEILPIADLVLSTSENEGMPIALIESQLACLPVIATDVGSVSEVIADGETGLVTNKNPQTIIAAVNTLITDTQKRTAMGTLATSRAQSLFSVERMINAHVGLYTSIVK